MPLIIADAMPTSNANAVEKYDMRNRNSNKPADQGESNNLHFEWFDFSKNKIYG